MKVGLLFKAQDPPDGKNIGRRWQEILARRPGRRGVRLRRRLPARAPHDARRLRPLSVGSAGRAGGAHGAHRHRHDRPPAAVRAPDPRGRAQRHDRHPLGRAAEARRRHGELPRRVQLLYGLNPKTQVSRFEEAIDIVRRAWAGEQIDHEGKHFNIKGHITPLPESPELWLGRHVRSGRPARGSLRRSLAHRPASQHRRDEALDGHLLRGGRRVRDAGRPRRRAPARRLGGRLARRTSRRSGGRASVRSTGSTSRRCRAGWRTSSRSSPTSSPRTTSSSIATASTG